jgi:serine phosphatase RsbU (regulator of sigma subunit)
MKRILAYCCLCLLLVTFAHARPALKGIVVDEVGVGLAEVEVVINGKYKAMTDNYGAFLLADVSPYIDINSVDALKVGFKLKTWGMVRREDGIEIHMKRTGAFSGRVRDDAGNPVAGAQVKLEGSNPFGPVTTDEKGLFSMKLPASAKINAYSKFSVNGKMLDDRQVVVSADNTTAELSYNTPRRTVTTEVVREAGYVEQRIAIIDRNGKPMRYFALNVNGKNRTTGEDGYLVLPAKDVASFKIFATGYLIEPSSNTDRNGNIQFVAVPEPGANQVSEADMRQSARIREAYESDFNSLFGSLKEEREMLAHKSDSLQTRIRGVVERFRRENNLTDYDRANLTQQLLMLEAQLIESNDSLQAAQERAEATLLDMHAQLLEMDSLNLLTNRTLERTKLEKEMVEMELQRDFAIFTTVALSLLAVVLAFAFFARRLSDQKKKVEKANAELDQANGKLAHTLEEVNALNQSITKQNQKITSSIRYAQTIQAAVLPTTAMMEAYFKEFFIVYEPKDIVSGDFYWAGATEGGRRRFMIAVDCTGHGVPGGFMSMIGHALLGDIIYRKKVTSPAEILEEMNRGIREALKQDQKVNEDGMDVCCCMLEDAPQSQTKLTFAGAMRPLYVALAGEDRLQVLKGDHKSAGGLQLRADRKFTNQELLLPKGSSFYLTSDGFGDQHNLNKEKLGTRGLISLIEDRLPLPMQRQGDSLREQFELHKEGTEQRDDVMVIGIKV